MNNLKKTTIPKIFRRIGFGFIALLTCVQSMDPPEKNQIPEAIRPSVEKYLENLPKIDGVPNASIDEKAAAIVKLFIGMIPQRNTKTETVLGNLKGMDELVEKIKKLLENKDNPIKMITIGFPFKSSNHELKVIDERIDMGEFFGLLTYDHICREIQKIHPPGAHLILHSDGLVYSELDLQRSYTTYQRDLKKLIGFFPSISLAAPLSKGIVLTQPMGTLDVQTRKDISYFMQSELSCAAWKKKILRENINSVGLENPSEPNKNGTWKIFTHINGEKLRPFNMPSDKVIHLEMIENNDIDEFIYACLDEEFVKILKDPLIEETSKIINKEIERKKVEFTDFAATTSGQFSNTVKSVTPNYNEYIRLSVHPHSNISEKCGIGIIYGSTCTPWHACPILGTHGIKVVAKEVFMKELGKKRLNPNDFLKTVIINDVSLQYFDFNL